MRILGELISRFLRHAGFRGYRVLAIAPGGDPFAPPSGFEVRHAGGAELCGHARDPALGLDPAWITAAEARGDRCVVALAAGRIAGYAWLAPLHAPYEDRHGLRVPEGMLYAYKAYVRPEYRGRGLGRALYRFGAVAAAQCGRGQLLLLVSPRNGAGIASARGAGAEDLGALVLWLSGSRLRVLRSPSQRLRIQFAPFPLPEVEAP